MKTIIEIGILNMLLLPYMGNIRNDDILNKAVKGIGKTYRHKLSLVLEKNKDLITPAQTADILNIKKQEAGRLLSRWQKNGWLCRIGHGKYIPVSVELSSNNITIEDPWVIAFELFKPGYIGGFSAVKHWDFSEQIFETVVFFTIKQIKPHHQTYSGIKFHIKTILSKKMFGTKSVWRKNIKIQVSDPSKTIVDLFDDPAMGGSMRAIQDIFLEYINSEYADINLLIEYALKMNNKTILKRLGFLLDISDLGDQLILEKIQAQISKGYSIFDPTQKNDRIIKKWALKISQSWKDLYDRKK